MCVFTFISFIDIYKKNYCFECKKSIRGILVYEYTLAQCLTFRVRFDYTWIIRVFPAPPGGPN